MNPVLFLGESAGGNLAAAVALVLRDEDYDSMPKLQVLIYPALQAIDFLTPSYQKHEYNAPLLKDQMVQFWAM